jgi:hypothetical protein
MSVVLMINAVQGHRTNSIQEAINYLKSDHDHIGTLRNVKPRDFAGSALDCVYAVESIDRKHKYVSGSLAFEPSERPTDKELLAVVDSFRKTFMAGLEHGVNFVDFWNIHEDKGRIELNYVIPLTELTTGRRINPFPPGKAKEDFKDSFDAYINHQLGFNQVVRDPLKASNSKFETKVLPYSNSKLANEVRAKKPDKENISANVAYQIHQGKINNRQQLCDYLENFGEITRVNDKFISLKIHGSQKAFRLKGPVYENSADFQKLKIESATKDAPYRKQLNDSDFQKVRSTLARLTNSRREFNQKLISQPMTDKTRLYGAKAIPIQTAPINEVQQAPQKAPTQVQALLSSAAPKQAPVIAQKQPTAGKTAMKDAPAKEGSSSGPTSMDRSSDASIGNLQAQLSDLINQIANAKDPAKAASLKVRAMKIENQIGAAVEADRIKKLKESERFSGIKKKY